MGPARAKLPSPGSNWTSRNTSARCFRMCRASTLAPCTLRPERSRNARALNGIKILSSIRLTLSMTHRAFWSASKQVSSRRIAERLIRNDVRYDYCHCSGSADSAGVAATPTLGAAAGIRLLPPVPGPAPPWHVAGSSEYGAVLLDPGLSRPGISRLRPCRATLRDPDCGALRRSLPSSRTARASSRPPRRASR